MSTLARPAPERRLRRIEPQALAGVLFREWVVFRRLAWPTTFASVVEPLIYLLAFGFGFGALVSEVAGYDYIEFIGTGIVATAVLFSSAFPGMFATFVRRRFQHTYDAILAAPVDVPERVTAEALWLALRCSVFGMVPLAVATAFGLRPGPGAALVPLVAFVTGFGFACCGIFTAALFQSINSFDYVISAVLTPLFLVAGTFFPVSELPIWAARLAQVNPLYHCVELVRAAVFGVADASIAAHVAALLVFAAVAWAIAVRRMTARLID
jgi:lipooligosaccharide transport system permease protein